MASPFPITQKSGALFLFMAWLQRRKLLLSTLGLVILAALAGLMMWMLSGIYLSSVPIAQVEWNPDGKRLAVVHQTGEVRLLNRDKNGALTSRLLVAPAPGAEIKAEDEDMAEQCRVLWSPDGSMFTTPGGETRERQVWRIFGETGEASLVHTFICTYFGTPFVWAPDGRLLVTDFLNLETWKPDTGQVTTEEIVWPDEIKHYIYPSDINGGNKFTIAPSPNGRFALSAQRPCLVDLRQPYPAPPIRLGLAAREGAGILQQTESNWHYSIQHANCAAWSPEGDKLALLGVRGTDITASRKDPAGEVCIFDAQTESVKRYMDIPLHLIPVNFSACGPNTSQSFGHAFSYRYRLCWSPDGRRLACKLKLDGPCRSIGPCNLGKERQILLLWWDVATGKLLATHRLESHTLGVQIEDAVLSPNLDQIAVCSRLAEVHAVSVIPAPARAAP